MNPKLSGEILKHLEKQNELLMDAYKSMSHELHRLQVEEEMLMHKYYVFMEANAIVEKKRNCTDATEDIEIGSTGALVIVPNKYEQQ